MTRWSEQSVDEAIEQAWLTFRVRLADLLAAGREVGAMEPIGVAADGETIRGMVIWLREDGRILVKPEGAKRARGFDNPDEAAFAMAKILRVDWQVVHPAFLFFDDDHGLVDVGGGDLPSHGLPAPEVGHAESMEELHDWVVRAFQPEYDKPLSVDEHGHIAFVDHEGGPQVVVAVRNEFRIEVWHVLARNGDPEAIRRLVDTLAADYSGIRFHREDGRSLVMSIDVIAHPFARDQVTFAVGQLLHLAEELAWVGERLERPARRLPSKPSREVPPALAGLMANANRLLHPLLVEAVEEAAGDEAELRRWRTIARREIRAAQRLPRGEADPYRVAHRIRRGWVRLERALAEAIMEQAEEVA